MTSYGTTADGHPITPDLIVFTNEFRVGKVVGGSMTKHTPGWFDVRYRDGSGVLQNAERVATAFGRDAESVYRWGHDWTFPGGNRLCALCGATEEDSDGRCPEAPQSREDDRIVRKHGEG